MLLPVWVACSQVVLHSLLFSLPELSQLLVDLHLHSLQLSLQVLSLLQRVVPTIFLSNIGRYSKVIIGIKIVKVFKQPCCVVT